MDEFELVQIRSMPPKRKAQKGRRPKRRGGDVYLSPFTGEKITSVTRVRRMYAIWDPVTTPGTTGVNDSFGVRTFNYSNLAQSGDLVVAFRFYRIEKVEVHYIPIRNAVLIETTTQRPSLPSILTIADFVDATKPTTTAYLQANQTVQVWSGERPHKRIIKPMFADAIYRSTTGSGYSPGRGWVETSYGDVPWYGFKWSSTFDGAGTVTTTTGWFQYVVYLDLAMMI